ncbi:hypothetical protein DFH06DRAFT_1151199 [Mycena polygramma]|nr:hypothetical protein DFH06DRAFT_1151199 [Mycena polygramma]
MLAPLRFDNSAEEGYLEASVPTTSEDIHHIPAVTSRSPFPRIVPAAKSCAVAPSSLDSLCSLRTPLRRDNIDRIDTPSPAANGLGLLTRTLEDGMARLGARSGGAPFLSYLSRHALRAPYSSRLYCIGVELVYVRIPTVRRARLRAPASSREGFLDPTPRRSPESPQPDQRPRFRADKDALPQNFESLARLGARSGGAPFLSYLSRHALRAPYSSRLYCIGVELVYVHIPTVRRARLRAPASSREGFLDPTPRRSPESPQPDQRPRFRADKDALPQNFESLFAGYASACPRRRSPPRDAIHRRRHREKPSDNSATTHVRSGHAGFCYRRVGAAACRLSATRRADWSSATLRGPHTRSPKPRSVCRVKPTLVSHVEARAHCGMVVFGGKGQVLPNSAYGLAGARQMARKLLVQLLHEPFMMHRPRRIMAMLGAMSTFSVGAAFGGHRACIVAMWRCGTVYDDRDCPSCSST